MDDLISKQAAIEIIKNYCENGCDYAEDNWCPSCQREKFVELLKALPSAQPERKKGRWIPVDSYSAFGGDEATWMAHGNPVAFYYCSECKEQAYAGEDGESLLTAYCPNCGAYMRGEQDD